MLTKATSTSKIKLTVLNDTTYHYDTLKKIEINVPLNYTLLELKKAVAKECNITWQELRLHSQSKKELTDLMNCRTIAELGLQHSKVYTASKKFV